MQETVGGLVQQSAGAQASVAGDGSPSGRAKTRCVKVARHVLARLAACNVRADRLAPQLKAAAPCNQ